MQTVAFFMALPLAAAQLYANGTSQITSSKLAAAPDNSPSPTPSPGVWDDGAPTSSNDETTYVTVVEGKTLTVTTRKPTQTPVAFAGVAAPSPSNDQTTYVTVVRGRTLTVTTNKPTPTGVMLANAGNVAGAAVPVAALGAAVFLL